MDISEKYNPLAYFNISPDSFSDNLKVHLVIKRGFFCVRANDFIIINF